MRGRGGFLDLPRFHHRLRHRHCCLRRHCHVLRSEKNQLLGPTFSSCCHSHCCKVPSSLSAIGASCKFSSTCSKAATQCCPCPNGASRGWTCKQSQKPKRTGDFFDQKKVPFSMPKGAQQNPKFSSPFWSLVFILCICILLSLAHPRLRVRQRPSEAKLAASVVVWRRG